MVLASGAVYAPLRVSTLLACLSLAAGHGFLREPKGRQLLAYIYNPASVGWCPQCSSAGGPGTVSGGGAYTWPAGVHGICGDPAAGPLTLEVGGSAYTGVSGGTYSEGSVLEVDFNITAFHMGRVQMRVCRVEGPDLNAAEQAGLTEACLDQNVLVQANVPGAQTPGEQYFYLGTASNGATSFTAYYQLPAGLTCDGVAARCILQWYWVTGNSCTPPGTPQQFAGPTATCGAGVAYPEEFWNCADISILASGVPLPSPSPVVFPSPSGGGGAGPTPSPTTNPSSSAIPSGTFALGSGCPSGNASCFCTWKGLAGRFADPGSGCAYYYECSGPQQAYYRACGAGNLLFSDTTTNCDWDYNVACVSEEVVVSPQPDVPLSPLPPADSPSPVPAPLPSPPASSPPPAANPPPPVIKPPSPSPSKQGSTGSPSLSPRNMSPSPVPRPSPASSSGRRSPTPKLPKLTRPATPKLLSKAVSKSLVEIKIKPAAGAAAYAIRCPQVARPAKQIKTVTTKTAVTFKLTGLKPKTPHRCFIAARNRAGSSRELAVTFMTKPKQ